MHHKRSENKQLFQHDFIGAITCNQSAHLNGLSSLLNLIFLLVGRVSSFDDLLWEYMSVCLQLIINLISVDVPIESKPNILIKLIKPPINSVRS